MESIIEKLWKHAMNNEKKIHQKIFYNDHLWHKNYTDHSSENDEYNVKNSKIELKKPIQFTKPITFEKPIDTKSIFEKGYNIKDIVKKAKRATFDVPVDRNYDQVLLFDGKKLTLIENDKRKRAWNAISGDPDFQDKKYQNIINKGPLPEGIYAAKKSEYQKMSDCLKEDGIRKKNRMRCSR